MFVCVYNPHSTAAGDQYAGVAAVGNARRGSRDLTPHHPFREFTAALDMCVCTSDGAYTSICVSYLYWEKVRLVFMFWATYSTADALFVILHPIH